MKRKIFTISLLLSALMFSMLQFVSCDDTNEPDPPATEEPDTEDPDTEEPDTEEPDTEEPGEDKTIGRPESLEIRSGNKRVEISWLVSDPQVNGYKILYNNNRDSVENTIDRKYDTDTVSVLIEDLEETTRHTFSVFNLDDEGDASVQSNISGSIYGSRYQNSITDARITSHVMEDGDLKIKWNANQQVGLLGVNLEYVEADGNIANRYVTDLDMTILENYSRYESFSCQSQYLPEATALDTFFVSKTYTPYSKIDAQTFAGQIQQKSELGVNSIQKNVTTTITPGLTYTELVYMNNNNAPMALYILLADIDYGVSLKASGAANGNNLNSKETVKKQIGYVQDRGHEVLAAVNGDFWRVNATENDNTPMGQTYGALFIEGTMKKDTTRTLSEYYYTAILDDGTFVIGNKANYASNKNRIKESIGGRYLLVDNSQYLGNKISNKDIAPRTSVGLFDSNWVVFIVVDGRRPSHSQGVTMQELAHIYNAIGVKTALNLDGGGSTTLWVKGEGNGQLELKNRPSDNSERSVANSWTIVTTD